MKKLITLLLLVSTNLVVAEYNGCYISFTMETTNHKIINGYVYVAQVYFEKDSIKNKNYVLERFDVLDKDGENGSILFYKNRIDYHYSPVGSEESALIYTLLDTQRVFLDSVAHITITEMIDYWYLSGISTSHTLADTTWMKKPPVQSAIASGYLCSWEIFVHEQTAQTKQILADLETSRSKFEKQLNDLEEIKKYADGKEHRNAEEQISDLEEQMDDVTYKILERFDGQKVVIVAFCSC